MKIYFYNKDNLKEIPKSRFGIDLKTLNSMIFENLEGENFTQEELKIKYIQENHYSKYNPEIHILSDKEYINPILENGVLREKTLVELKLENPDLLEDGEYISLNQIIKVEKPSEFRIWNKLTNTWDIDDELIAYHINDITNELSSIRDEELAIGTMFEGDKLIKGRTQDISHAVAQVILKQLGGEIKWFFSNNITEDNISLERMMQISTAIGNYSTSRFDKEKEVFHHITQELSNEEVENFSLEEYWWNLNI